MECIALSAIITLPMSFSAAGADCYWVPMMHGRIFMALLWILFLILLLILVYGLVKGKRANFLDWPSGDAPLDILKRRYAKGEITKEEFERIKSDLT